MSYNSRPFSGSSDDLSGMHARCSKLADMSYGLSMVFGALVAVSGAGGVWLHQPLLASSAGVALAAAAAFGVSGQALSRAARNMPRGRAAYAMSANDRRRG